MSIIVNNALHFSTFFAVFFKSLEITETPVKFGDEIRVKRKASGHWPHPLYSGCYTPAQPLGAGQGGPLSQSMPS